MSEIVVEHVRHPSFLSNAFVIGTPGGAGAVIDVGADAEGLVGIAARHRLTITHVLLTHHHHDHVSELAELLERLPATGGAPATEVLVHPDERALTAQQVDGVTGTIAPGDVVGLGDLELEAIHVPGHTLGMLAFHGGGHVFTGDTLFRDSVGGVRAPAHTTFEDLRTSVMERLLTLPPETVVQPGHMESTTVGREHEHNPFVRVWRGLDEEGSTPATVRLPDDDGLDAEHDVTLVLRAPDYDGGTKCWIRWPDGADDLVPGSRVEER